MGSKAKKRTLPFLTAWSKIESDWGIEMKQESFIESAYPVWRNIGNIATEKEVCYVRVPQDKVVYLPSNCEFIDSVSQTLEDNNSNVINYNSAGGVLETRPNPTDISYEASVKTSLGYAHGEPVEYVTQRGYIHIVSDDMIGQDVKIVYCAIDVDSDGLPMLNDRELEAISVSVALKEARKQMFQRIDGARALVQELTPLAKEAMANASVAEKINKDTLEKLSDIKYSWDAKRYGDRSSFLR